MKIIRSAAHSSNPIADAFVRAIREWDFNMIGPSDDPGAVFYQAVVLASPRMVEKFWDKRNPLEPDFEHWPYRGDRGLLALGTGAWFEPWVSEEALAFCAAQIAPDGQRDLTPLAEWVRVTAKPGGAITWWDPNFNPDKRWPQPQPSAPPKPSWWSK